MSVYCKGFSIDCGDSENGVSKRCVTLADAEKARVWMSAVGIAIAIRAPRQASMKIGYNALRVERRSLDSWSHVVMLYPGRRERLWVV
jgi:hypothetical protein